MGSSDTNEIRIDDAGVSEQHAVIHRTGSDTWEVTDQMSTNVLIVNGNTTNKCFLANGDLITLGATDCEFVLPKGYRVRERKSAGRKSQKIFLIIAIVLIVSVAVGVYLARNYM